MYNYKLNILQCCNVKHFTGCERIIQICICEAESNKLKTVLYEILSVLIPKNVGS